MARLMEGIKELLGKGKDDDDELPEYRYRYDQRQSPGSNRVYGYPATGTAEVRSGYRRPFGEALDDNYVRNGYDARASPRGAEYRKPYESSPRGAEYASPRGNEYPSPRGTEYRRPYVGSEVASPRGEYVRAPLESPRGSRRDGTDGTVIEFMVPMCCDKCKEKVTEELGEVDGVQSVRCDPPNSRVIVTGDDSIDVERCLKKAERAVKKKCELISTAAGAGARDSDRYISAMDRSYGSRDGTRDSPRDIPRDIPRDYTRDYTRDGTREGTRDGTREGTRDGTRDYTRDGTRDYPREFTRDGPRDVTRDSARDGPRNGSRVALVSPSGRPSLGRLPSFASGKVTQYDGVGPRGQDYDAKDYNGSGFRRLPSFSKHRHHEAEYIASYDQRPEPLDSRREVYAVRRLPSFSRHRHHDAEYVAAGDREYSPRTSYESNAGGTYSSTYDERPVYRSQVSFSKLPVENPNYVKHIAF